MKGSIFIVRFRLISIFKVHPGRLSSFRLRRLEKLRSLADKRRSTSWKSPLVKCSHIARSRESTTSPRGTSNSPRQKAILLIAIRRTAEVRFVAGVS